MRFYPIIPQESAVVPSVEKYTSKSCLIFSASSQKISNIINRDILV